MGCGCSNHAELPRFRAYLQLLEDLAQAKFTYDWDKARQCKDAMLNYFTTLHNLNAQTHVIETTYQANAMVKSSTQTHSILNFVWKKHAHLYIDVAYLLYATKSATIRLQGMHAHQAVDHDHVHAQVASQLLTSHQEKQLDNIHDAFNLACETFHKKHRTAINISPTIYSELL